MRLLIITDTFPPDINGVARSLHTLAAGLVRRGHVVQVVTTLEGRTEQEGELVLPRYVMPSMPLPGYPGLRIGFGSARKLQEVYDTFSPEVLYVATETPLGIAAIQVAGRRKIPVVSGFHTNFQTYLEEYHLPGMEAVAAGILRSIHNATARTLTPSQDTAEMLRRWGIQNVGVLGRGVDTELFDPARRSAELRQSWGADENTPVLLYVGRIAPEKNLPLGAHALETARKTHPDVKMVIVGDGPRLEAMRKDYPELIYAGAKRGEELAAHYASADLFIFPSLSETFGNVVLEAMSSGLSTVAFDYAAPRLLIRGGENGWLAAMGDEESFLNRVTHALERWDDSALRCAARETAHQHGWAGVVAQFESELASALAERAVEIQHQAPA